GREAPPEFREHQRGDGQQAQHDDEAGPVAAHRGRQRIAGGRHHFGVGTNSPVGRKSSVRMSATKDTMTAWAGLTQIDANDSSRLMKIAARMEPPRLPMPPTTTTTNAFSVQSIPMAWLTPTIGPQSTPLAAAIAAPMANTTVCTRGTGMPIAEAMIRSCVVARIQMPYLPYFMKSQRPPMMPAESTAMTIRYQGYVKSKSGKFP